MKNINNKNESSRGMIEIQGIQFEYQREGEGETLVVIGSSTYYPLAFSKYFQSQFEMVYVDSRHFIPSYVPSNHESVNLSTWADDVESIRQHLNLGKITVVGHSVHAQIALEYATKYPQHTKRLVMVGGVPYSFAEFAEMADKYWIESAEPQRKAAFEAKTATIDSVLGTTPPEKQFAVSYDMKGALYWLDPDYDASPLLATLITSPKAFDVLFVSVPTKEEVRSKLQNLSVPTILILGKYDYAIPHTTWEEVIKGSKVDYYLMENASHNPFTEEVSQKEFDNILINWIANN